MSKFPTASFAIPAILILSVCILVAAAPAVHAWWEPNGVAVATLPDRQTNPRACPDGMGGAIIVYDEDYGLAGSISAQRVSASGNILWAPDGVAVCWAPGLQYNAVAVSDGAGGVIAAWQDERSGNIDIYVQRLSPTGASLWPMSGVALCTDAQDQENPCIVSDGAGGAIVVWRDFRSGNYDVYAQRVSAFGIPQWTANGVALCTAAGSQASIAIASDGAGGAIVAWADFRSGNYDIYTQRVDLEGHVEWTANGVAICTAADYQTQPAIAIDGTGGAIIAWTDRRSTISNIYAQRVSESGTVRWAANGIPLYATADQQSMPQIASDGAGGAIIAWGETRKGVGIYAQRVNQSGTRLWSDGGYALAEGLSDLPALLSAPDGLGGLIVAGYVHGQAYDLFAQRISASRIAPWGSTPTTVCAAVDDQMTPSIASDGAGGAIIVWRDSRSGEDDIYAQLIDSRGRAGWLAPDIASAQDVPGDQGGQVFLSWDAARADRYMDTDAGLTHYTIWRSIDVTQAALAIEGGASEIGSLAELDSKSGDSVIRVEETGALTIYWQLVDTHDAFYMEGYGLPVATLFDSTAASGKPHYFQVIGHTATPTVFWKSDPASGWSVDNIAPGAPVGLDGERRVAPFGLNLTWDPNTESDFSCYALYRGLSEDFVPEAENLVAQLDETEYFDGEWNWGGYYYKLSAFDVSGNESEFSLLAPDGVTDVETPKAPTASYLAQNFPNPFNPTTRISFGLAAPADVSLRIYDAAGRLVCALVEEARLAGNYAELWDGRDARGAAVASGIYFYRLQAGAFSETRKMALLR